MIHILNSSKQPVTFFLSKFSGQFTFLHFNFITDHVEQTEKERFVLGYLLIVMSE